MLGLLASCLALGHHVMLHVQSLFSFLQTQGSKVGHRTSFSLIFLPPKSNGWSHVHASYGGKMAGGDEVKRNLPWVEKYRPKSLDELISHKEIISTSKFLWWIARS